MTETCVARFVSLPSSDGHDAHSTPSLLAPAAACLTAVGLAGYQVNPDTELSELSERPADPGDAETTTATLRTVDIDPSGEDVDVVPGTVVKRTRAGREALDTRPVRGDVD